MVPSRSSYAFIVDGLRGALQFPPIWPALAELYEQLDRATLAPHTAAPAVERATAAKTTAADDGDAYDNAPEALLAVSCSETTNPSVPGCGR